MEKQVKENLYNLVNKEFSKYILNINYNQPKEYKKKPLRR